MGWIYLLINKINGKLYVGYSVDLSRRLREHKRRSKQIIDKAIKKYGWENFAKIVWKKLPYEKLKEEEIRWEKFFDCQRPKGYNQIPAGGGLGKRLSEETRKKISLARTGKHHTQETKNRMSENHADFSGENHPMYGKRGTSSPLYGRTHSEETKRKMSEAQRGEKNHMYRTGKYKKKYCEENK